MSADLQIVVLLLIQLYHHPVVVQLELLDLKEIIWWFIALPIVE